MKLEIDLLVKKVKGPSSQRVLDPIYSILNVHIKNKK